MRFYTSQVSLALDHMHSNNIIYRDLKLENLMLDDSGYLKLSNLTYIKKLTTSDRTKSFCGTPEYLAPEVILGKGYSKSVDWWALGILMYEMVFGVHPFYNEHTDRMYELICHSEVRFPRQIPISFDCQDIISKLLDKNENTRLGVKGEINEIRSHPFFSSYNFDAIYSRKLFAPINSNLQKDDVIGDINEKEFSIIEESGKELIANNESLFNEF